MKICLITFLALSFSGCLFNNSNKNKLDDDIKIIEKIFEVNNILKDVEQVTDLSRKRVQFLNLQNLNIKELPTSIGNLDALEVLNLDSNDINTLPESMAKLNNLKKINLAKNNIKEFPLGFSKINGLEEINLTYNKIESIPSIYLDKTYLIKKEICLGPCGQTDCCQIYESNGLYINYNQLCILDNETKDWINQHYAKSNEYFYKSDMLDTWENSQQCK